MKWWQLFSVPNPLVLSLEPARVEFPSLFCSSRSGDIGGGFMMRGDLSALSHNFVISQQEQEHKKHFNL